MGALQHRLFIGTYTKTASRGIHLVALDARTGALGEARLAAEAPNPTFLALAPSREYLYAVCAGPDWLSSFRVDPATAALTPVQQKPAGAGPTPCHVAIDQTGCVAVAANYHLGEAAAIPLNADGTLDAPRVVAHHGRGPSPTRQSSSHVHSTNIAPDNRFTIVCDLGLDRIYTYSISRGSTSLVPGTPPFAETAAQAGPRHLAFDKLGARAYVINEIDCTVVVYGYDPTNGSLSPRQTVSVLPPGSSGESTAAEVALHPNGRYLYASTRGADTLAVFTIGGNGALALVEFVPAGGKGPRHFSLSPDGAWLVCAHQDSDTLCSFQVDGATGRLRRIPGTAAVPMPVCALFLD